MKNYLFLVLQEGGVFIYSYPKITSDENVLLSALIHAVSAIERELMRSKEGKYKLQSSAGTLYVYFKEPFFFAVITKDKIRDRDLWAMLNHLASLFIEKFPEAEEGLVIEERMSEFDEIVENVLGKAQRWLMSYHINELSKAMLNRFYEERRKIPLKMRARILRGFSRIRGRLEWLFISDKVNSVLVSGLLYINSKSEEELHKLGRKFAEFLFRNFKGVKSLMLSRSVLDDWMDKDLLLSYLLGKDFSKIKYKVENGKILEILELEDNPICSILSRTEKNLKYSSFLAGIFEFFSELKLDKYDATDVKCYESKCITTGDNACEFIIEWKLKEEKRAEIEEKIKGELIIRG